MGVNQEEPSLCYVSTPWANNTEVSASTGASGPDSSQPSRNPATARNALGSAWLTGQCTARSPSAAKGGNSRTWRDIH